MSGARRILNAKCEMPEDDRRVLLIPTPHSLFRIRHSTLRAFTLVEMVIVVAIVIALLGLVVPAASQMWRDRKIADAQNLISGMLMVARARALEGAAGETGLFFYLDDRGVQQVVHIAQRPFDPADPPPDPSDKAATDAYNDGLDWRTAAKWRNVFSVVRGRPQAIAAPMRVVPRYAVCADETSCEGYTQPYQLFSDGELANNKFADADLDSDHHVGQLHRNFFTIVYTTDGQLTVRRDVLIRDWDGDFSESPGGDVTGLKVGSDGSPAVSRYYRQEDVTTPASIVPGTPSASIDFLVTDRHHNAINFPSVDGVLIYDDAVFNQIDTPAQKRQFLMETARAFYVQRTTGAVVRGPVGEGRTP